MGKLLNTTYDFVGKTLFVLFSLVLTGNRRRRTFLSAPDMVSLMRIPLGALITQTTNRPVIAVQLFVLAAFTDLVDGMLARKFYSTSKIGAVIDPICDKIFFACCALAYSKDFWPAILWPALAIEAIILIAPWLALRLKKMSGSEDNLKANIYGKAKFSLECLAVLLAICKLSTAANVALLVAIPFAITSIYRKIKDSR